MLERPVSASAALGTVAHMPTERLRAGASEAAHRAVRRLRRNSSPRAFAVRAALRGRHRPISSVYGYDRGTPIDRPYIEDFLRAHAADVRGRVLEVKSDDYARRFGGDRLAHVDVVDVDADNPRATLIADLDAPGALPVERYDCILLTQTLQFLTPAMALPTLYAALSPGGVLLLTVSALSRLDTPDSDRWRLPPAGLQDLLDTCLPAQAERVVEGRGNAVAAAAFMLGLAVEEMGPRQLEPVDWRYPLVSLARVRRTPGPAA